MTVTGIGAARPHRLSDAALAALGAGRPGPGVLDELRRVRMSRHLLLLRQIAALAGTACLRELSAAETTHPARTRALLDRPLFGVWAAGCLTALRDGASPEAAGVGHLTELAARARIPRPRQAERLLTAAHDGLSISVRLEDSDPLRARLGLTPTPPLSEAGAARWQAAFTEAWRLLVDRVRPDAEVLSRVLDCVVPVETDPAARGISATSVHAYGAVAISEPADPAALAVGLLHEANHSILNAVLYLFDLLEAPDTPGYSPWRDDPRPASGILHGAYAYLTVTRFWRTRPEDPLARFEFARWRAAVAAAAEGLTGLTPAGERFVGALLDEVRPWLAEPVGRDVLRLAEGANRDHHLRWRLRNLRVDPADAAALARAWRRGERPPPVTARLHRAPRRALEASARLDLAHRLLRGLPLEGSAGDLAYVRGDHGAALRAYRENRGDRTDWAGLLLVSGVPVAPEVAAAAGAALGADRPDPLAIVNWLS
ncbi:aKG-HExxH-type peptide beta-hydroxylase [Nucisporomicrobium flavum]|uniref:aKG-HExxH-type peptide beta-hydroxylase n=1 Tax=Nucisporomicrobium flavum TaxID=2785915 RepID=UPI0018F36E20|nr:HEXXH motif-containing putative peptide modification protein [Nucisporomicrobium flavum]